MLVYRLENEKGEGVYSRGFGYSCTASALNKSADAQDMLPEDTFHHPGPAEDALLMEWWTGSKLSPSKKREWQDKGRKEWYCAFSSMDQMLNWFPKAGLERMANMAEQHKDSMALVVYYVTYHRVKRGEHQVMYRNDGATRVSRITLAEVLAML